MKSYFNLVDESFERLPAIKAEQVKSANYRDGDEDTIRNYSVAEAAIVAVGELSEPDFVRAMSHEGRKDMARGNAARLIRRVAAAAGRKISVAQAKAAAAELPASRFTRQNYKSVNHDSKPTAGITATTDMIKSEIVYAAAYAAAKGAAK